MQSSTGTCPKGHLGISVFILEEVLGRKKCQLFLLRTLLGFLDVISEREAEPVRVLYKMDTDVSEAKGRRRSVF